MNDDTPLGAVKAQWKTTISGKGGHCPCCDRWGKINSRQINSTMARSLIWLYRADPVFGWVNVPACAPRWLLKTNQLASLRWWGLVDRAPSDDPDMKHSGVWRITMLGCQFVRGIVTVPRKVYVYDADVVGTSSEETDIREALGKHFSYAEVMGDAYSAREPAHV